MKQKNEQCEKLITDIKEKESIINENSGNIPLPEDVKESFINALTIFKNNDDFEYVYSEEETDNYIVTESLNLNYDNQIDILYTFNDLGIAAKKHQHYKTLDEMLMQYMKYFERTKNQEEHKSL